MKTKLNARLRGSCPLGVAFFAGITFSAILLSSPRLCAQGENNPTGVTGIYNGNVTTAGNYDPLTHNDLRIVDDITVPGSIGAYPLKWTRYFNSRDGNGNWNYSYNYYLDPTTGQRCAYPDGRFLDFGASCPPTGLEEGIGSWTGPDGHNYAAIGLGDGGKVAFSDLYNVYIISQGIEYASSNRDPIYVIDPYGQITTITYTNIYNSDGTLYGHRRDRITEPGRRYLQINYQTPDLNSLISSVQAFDGQGNMTQSVTYTWVPWTSPQGKTFTVLSQVTYSDGTSANYHYTQTGGGSGQQSIPIRAVLATADDVRYGGAMRQIGYTYLTGAGANGQIASENNMVTGAAVSSIAGATETRGDGATRTFTYGTESPTKISLGICFATLGKLLSYTDFLGHTTTISYESDDTSPSFGFINAVTDPNGRTTSYTRQTNSWGITTITHPDGSTIQQTFWQDNPHYLASRTDELGHTTIFTRDPSYRITRKDYPDGAFETFTYNNFGEVLSHEMTSGGTESFLYDGRGLKTSYTDATGGVTTYSYYTSGPWTDRPSRR